MTKYLLLKIHALRIALRFAPQAQFQYGSLLCRRHPGPCGDFIHVTTASDAHAIIVERADSDAWRSR
jgi:hypothetical protein